MREISILKRRILQYIEIKGITKYEFYKLCNLSNGILSQKNGLSEDSILKILNSCDDINPLWWFFGEGDILLSSKAPDGELERKKTASKNKYIISIESKILIKELIKRVTEQAIKIGQQKNEIEHLKKHIKL